jgi:hypothetical protein
MPSSGALRRVAVIRTDVSEERIASIRVTRVDELGTLAVTSNRSPHGVPHSHRLKCLKSYIALTGWALQRRRNVSPVRNEQCSYIPEDDILHSHRRENVKYYIALTGWAL